MEEEALFFETRDTDNAEVPVTAKTFLDACDPFKAAVIVIAGDVHFKLDSNEGVATPAMIELAQLAMQTEERPFLEHVRNTIVVLRCPGAINPFREGEECRLLKTMVNDHNAIRLATATAEHALIVAQFHDGSFAVCMHSGNPFSFIPRVQVIYALAKSIQAGSPGVVATIMANAPDPHSKKIIEDAIKLL